MTHRFEPVPGIWRFHLIYLFVTASLGWSYFPYATYSSFLLISTLCAVGMLLAYVQWSLETHILAVVVGLGTPVVVFGALSLFPTAILFSLMTLGVFLGRRVFF